MRLLTNNIKAIGIYVAVSLLSIPLIIPLWNIAEYRGNTVLTSSIAILFSLFTLALFFCAGRFFIKSTGVLMHDCLSIMPSIVIVCFCCAFAPEISRYFTIPHLFFALLLNIISNNEMIGVLVSVGISLLALLAGAITKMRPRNGSLDTH